jgi:putative redox protein
MATTEELELNPADVVVHGNAAGFLQEITSGKHHLRADEPLKAGGGDAAPGPYDYLLIGLGACTSMTIGLYARKRNWPLEDITVALRHSRIHAKDCAECETENGMLDRIDVEVGLAGALTAEQRAKLVEIAGKCPVHRTLTSEINIRLHAAANPITPPAAVAKNSSANFETRKEN